MCAIVFDGHNLQRLQDRKEPQLRLICDTVLETINVAGPAVTKESPFGNAGFAISKKKKLLALCKCRDRLNLRFSNCRIVRLGQRR